MNRRSSRLPIRIVVNVEYGRCARLHLIEYFCGALHRYTTLSVSFIIVDVRVAFYVIDVDDDVTFDYSICRNRLSRIRIWQQMTIRLSIGFASSACQGCHVLWDDVIVTFDMSHGANMDLSPMSSDVRRHNIIMNNDDVVARD